jgi:putative NADPH-quinone reductase
MGRFYNNGRIYENGVFKGKRALLSLTTGGPEKNYKDLYGDIEGILKPIHRGILEFTGWTVLQPQIIYAVERQMPEALSTELETWKHRLENIFDEQPINVGA